MPSEKPSKPKYRLQFVPSAWAEWQALDGSVKETLRKLLKKRLENPQVPGGELHGALKGHYKKLNAASKSIGWCMGFRTIFIMVMVMAFDKREDSAVYQAAMARISELISELSNVTPKRH